jgi:hypothetical protein
MDQAPNGVHFVGSIGLDTVEDVFRVVGSRLGGLIRRIPDGEIGGRRMWITWQYPVLRGNPFVQADPSGAVRPTNRFPLLRLAAGVRPDDVVFGELNYAREARSSYQDFCTARQAGELPASARFQVCLPTPFAVVGSVVLVEPDFAAIEAAYERAMIAEVAAICRHIPHRDLCIQWDLCNEMIVWDGQKVDSIPHETTPKPDLLARMTRLCAAIPADVELGLHLCYGDFAGKQMAVPKDAGAMVDFANALVGAIAHPLAYIHMPVPPDRDDDAFFVPFDGLRLASGTELYLGLISASDGIAGAERRIAAARRHVTAFGVATECGFSRGRRPDLVRHILDIHAGVCGHDHG